jgi:hypothetical protein
MGIDVSDAKPIEVMLVDVVQHLAVRCRDGLGQIGQGLQNELPLPQVPQSQFTDHKGIRQHLPSIEQPNQKLIARPQMVDPYGRVDQNHPRPVRRRGGAVRWGSLPPSFASRRALSRSINALSASRTNADFSLRPVNAWALANNSSSSAMVVRTAISPS